MKRVSTGYYTDTFNGISFSVIKVEEVSPATRNKWYWQIGNEGGNDWFDSKKIAIEAAKERIKEFGK